MFLILHEIGHLTIYLFAAALMWIFVHKYFSWKGLVVGLVASFALDFDHLFDYILYRGIGFGFDMWEFFSGTYFIENGRALVIFHGWEYAIVLLLVFWHLREKDKVKKNWILFLALSMIAHLFWDTVTYELGTFYYSVIYRMFNSRIG